MTLEEALYLHSKANLTATTVWYHWKINPDHLPKGAVLSGGNHYEQNLSLKTQLNALYLSANNQAKIEIIRYYISKWGGIKRNSDKTINNYTFNSLESLIGKGTHGIASWSKALSIRHPNNCSIYDARVSVSLNCLQVTKAVNGPALFPLLPSQNKLIIEGNKIIRQFATMNGWATMPKNTFYQKYNHSLSVVANRLGLTPHTIEMILFAKAPELFRESFS